MVEALPEETKTERQTFAQAARDCNRTWALQFNLERTISDQNDNANLDLDEAIAFIEVVTKDQQALTSLGKTWDAR